MSKTSDILDIYKKSIVPTYAPTTVISRGKGTLVRDIEGLALYDFTSGIGVQNVGHCHPKVVGAIQEQASKLTHCSNLFANEPATKLAEKLVEISGLGGKVFFGNSGAEANDSALLPFFPFVTRLCIADYSSCKSTGALLEEYLSVFVSDCH